MRAVHRQAIARWLCERHPRYASLILTSIHAHILQECCLQEWPDLETPFATLQVQRTWGEQGIVWSTATAREATAAQARACGLSVAPDDALPTLIDIDTVEVLSPVAPEAAGWQGR